MNDANEPSCRVAVVGDSFVEARQVPVSDKLHVRFEDRARERLPALGITASAFGHRGTGQINQLGFYDEFVSRTSPHVVVLVFVDNDFNDNFWVLRPRFDRGRPWVDARRRTDGTLRLRPPTLTRFRPPRSVGNAPLSGSYFAGWLDAKLRVTIAKRDSQLERARRMQNPEYSRWFADWKDYPAQPYRFGDPKPPKAAREALEYTAFALDQWRARARRDGFLLAILASHTIGARGSPLFDRLERMASARDIPVVDQTGYIITRRNGRVQDAHFAHDRHWNAKGHRWAAEALLEWVEQNQDACGVKPQ